MARGGMHRILGEIEKHGRTITNKSRLIGGIEDTTKEGHGVTRLDSRLLLLLLSLYNLSRIYDKIFLERIMEGKLN